MLLPAPLRDALDELWSCDPTDLGSAVVRRTDPGTAHSAGASSRLRAGSQRHRLLAAFALVASEASYGARKLGDLTSDEAHELTVLPATACYWKRVSELAAAGYVEPSGATRKGRAGELQTCYRITDHGRTALRALRERDR